MVARIKHYDEEEKQRIINECKYSWDRGPGESVYNYQLFEEYLKLGRRRSYRAICELTSKTDKVVAKVASCYLWFSRAQEYDKYKTHQIQLELDEEVMLSKLRQLNVSKDLLQLSKEGAELLLDHPEEMTASDITKMADIGTKINNLAVGSPNEISEQKVELDAKFAVETIPLEISQKIGKEIAQQKSKEMEISI